jgi:N-acetylglucosamine-6-phosphate deacetylase
VRNLINFAGCSIADALRAVTANPAEPLRLPDPGATEIGARPGIVVTDCDPCVACTLVGGLTAWQLDRTRHRGRCHGS